MNFEKQWLFAPRLLALPFETRAAWCALAMSGNGVPLSKFVNQLKLEPGKGGQMLADLMGAGLVRMEGHVALDPIFVALSAIDLPEITLPPSPLSTVIAPTEEPPLFH